MKRPLAHLRHLQVQNLKLGLLHEQRQTTSVVAGVTQVYPRTVGVLLFVVFIVCIFVSAIKAWHMGS